MSVAIVAMTQNNQSIDHAFEVNYVCVHGYRICIKFIKLVKLGSCDSYYTVVYKICYNCTL